MSENNSNYGSLRSPNNASILELHKRWPGGVIQLPTTAEDVRDFIQWKMIQYEENNFTGSDLSQFYGEDFKEFTEETFN